MNVYTGGVLASGGVRPAGRETVLTGLAVLLVALVSGFQFGGLGVLVGVFLVVAWLVTPPIVVFALGQVLCAALIPADASLLTIAAVEAPLVLLVLSDVLDLRAPVRTLVLGVVSLAVFLGIVVTGIALLDALWQVGALLACIVALVSYGLHRYTVIALEVPNGV